MYGGLMDEEIFAAIVRGNEPETLAAIEPLHSPALLLANNNSSSSWRSCCCCCIFGHPPTAMDKNLHGRKKSLSTRPPAPVPSTKSQLRCFLFFRSLSVFKNFSYPFLQRLLTYSQLLLGIREDRHRCRA
jgi:hypothetical protein